MVGDREDKKGRRGRARLYMTEADRGKPSCSTHAATSRLLTLFHRIVSNTVRWGAFLTALHGCFNAEPIPMDGYLPRRLVSVEPVT